MIDDDDSSSYYDIHKISAVLTILPPQNKQNHQIYGKYCGKFTKNQVL